jgi:Plant transposon protein
VQINRWQKSARKDAERAFGVFRCKFKAIANPIYLLDPRAIASLVGCCLVLHNMAVSDRAMGDVNLRCDPGSVGAGGTQERLSAIRTPAICPGFVGTIPVAAAVTAISEFGKEHAHVIVLRKKMQGLKDEVEWTRLSRNTLGRFYCSSIAKRVEL